MLNGGTWSPANKARQRREPRERAAESRPKQGMGSQYPHRANRGVGTTNAGWSHSAPRREAPTEIKGKGEPPAHREPPRSFPPLPSSGSSTAASGRGAAACPRSIMRMRTCSWTRALRSRWASAASRLRPSSWRSEGRASEQTPASGCRADSKKALVSCMAAASGAEASAAALCRCVRL